MIVNGINKNRYLINNPIYVDITNIPSAASYVLVTIQPEENGQDNIPPSLRLYPINGALYFDLSEGIKSFFPVPDFKNETPLGQPILTNYLRAKISFAAVNSTGETLETVSSKNHFMRGGRKNHKTNQTLSANEDLRVSDKSPRWGAYPVRRFYLDDDNAIISTNLLPQDTENMRVVGCNPMYFKFLNTLGGYSYWLFEKWRYTENVKDSDVVRSRKFNYSLGAEPTYELEAEGRVDRRYFKTIRSLAESSEIYVYDLESKIFEDAITLVPGAARDPWTKVYGGKNKVETNSVQAVETFKLNFDVYPQQKPTVKW